MQNRYSITLNPAAHALALVASERTGVSIDEFVGGAVLDAAVAVVAPTPRRHRKKKTKVTAEVVALPKKRLRAAHRRTWECPECALMFAPQGRTMHYIACTLRAGTDPFVVAVQISDDPVLLSGLRVKQAARHNMKAVLEAMAKTMNRHKRNDINYRKITAAIARVEHRRRRAEIEEIETRNRNAEVTEFGVTID